MQQHRKCIEKWNEFAKFMELARESYTECVELVKGINLMETPIEFQKMSRDFLMRGRGDFDKRINRIIAWYRTHGGIKSLVVKLPEEPVEKEPEEEKEVPVKRGPGRPRKQ